MKKLLPIILSFIIFAGVIFPKSANAQVGPGQGNANYQAPTPIAVPTGGLWVVDPEVTFIGKNARRAGLMLNWTLQNYNWVCVTRVANRECNDTNNPLQQFWGLIVLYVVVPMLFVVILATAIVIIITRGRSLTIMRFIPRFVAVILLIVFSYSIVQFLYQFVDLIQGFFLRSKLNGGPCPPNCISDADLLYVGWDYRAFIGLRLLGDYNTESAFISLLLTKLTALTYFVMVGILLIRKIILWFFIIVSPIFPLLLLYYPTRNTGKIWIGEFFRWLLYAPLFAIFLNGLVFMWRKQIPLIFTNPNVGNPSAIIFPTAVNILLGGPRQFVTPTNSVNLTETFALYLVALLMLWGVILLPWILLQIFLDYAANFSPGDNAMMKTLINVMGKKPIVPPGGGGTSPMPPAGGGSTLALPFKKFNLPFAPGGVAKEMQIGSAQEMQIGSAQEMRTQAQNMYVSPTFMPNAQVKAQTLSVANVQLPTMRDIARYETALLSNDSSRQKEVSLARETLEKIANPVAIASQSERDKYSEIHEKLTEQSQQGNQLATQILTAANVASQSNAQATSHELRTVLRQIANPSSVTNSVEREKFSKLHDQLARESKEKNNQLASSILQVNDKTTTEELDKIKETLYKTKDNTIASSVLSTVNNAVSQQQQTTRVKSVLQQVANPNSVTNAADREKLSKLHESLSRESQKGNDLAASVLAVNEKTSTADIQKLQERIRDAKEKGNSIAGEVSTLTQKATISALPAVNRIQTVSKEDYEQVKKMWKENYHNLDVPQGMAGSRTEWIKDDIKQIDEIVGLLSSTDEEKVKQGMDEVSNILPFLLVGGFSQNEIIAYLKAKQEAAKEVSTEFSTEEAEKVEVNVHYAEAQKTMAASIEKDEGPTIAEQISAPSVNSSATNVVQPQASNELLAMANFKLPRMTDIAHFETGMLSKDKTRMAEAFAVKDVLEKIANPAPIQVIDQREKYEKLRDRLIKESQKGNSTADFILAAATRTTQQQTDLNGNLADIKTILERIAKPEIVTVDAERDTYTQLQEKLARESKENNNELATKILGVTEETATVDILGIRDELIKQEKEKQIAKDIIAAVNNYVSAKQLRTTLAQIANPTSVVSAVDKEHYTQLHEQLEKAKNEGNELAKTLLSVQETATQPELEKLQLQLKEAKESGDQLVSRVFADTVSSTIPSLNKVQPVSKEEYDEVKELWKENYKTLPVPQGFGSDHKGRIDWIVGDSKKVEDTVNMFLSPDAEKKNEGLKEVSDILPFLLLGGFSQQEMIAYLQAKQEAAKVALDELQKDEGQKVAIPQAPAENAKEMAVDEEKDNS